MSDELQLSIEKLVYGGDGLGHAEGNTVFVPYVLPGEEVRAEIVARIRRSHGTPERLRAQGER